MDELQDMDSLLNGCRNIVEQFRDAEAMHASGAISDEEFYERQGRKNASLRVIAAIEGGEADRGGGAAQRGRTAPRGR